MWDYGSRMPTNSIFVGLKDKMVKFCPQWKALDEN